MDVQGPGEALGKVGALGASVCVRRALTLCLGFLSCKMGQQSPVRLVRRSRHGDLRGTHVEAPSRVLAPRRRYVSVREYSYHNAAMRHARFLHLLLSAHSLFL